MEMHEGHRERLKKRFVSGGAESMREHEILELMLTYAIPRKDVNPLAHKLISRYGSLYSVLTESPASLVTNDGISMHTAILLNLLGMSPAQLAGLGAAESRIRVVSIGESMSYCRELLTDSEAESFCAVLLDAKSRVAFSYVEHGESNSVGFDFKRLIMRAVAFGARSVVLAHLHAEDHAVCSDSDVRLTERVSKALAEVDIRLSEHIILARYDCMAVLHGVTLRDRRADGEYEAEAELKLIG